MTLSELLGTPVHDAAGHRVGRVADVRLVMAREGAAPRVHGLLVSPGAYTPFLGFERTDARAPWPVGQVLRWLQRGAFMVRWADVELRPDRVVLRAQAPRWSTDLPEG